jgi:phage portal protein BeeE
VNESLLGITENSNRSSSKEADLIFRDAIAARQLLVEEEINNKLILGMFGWDDILFEENDSSKRGQLEQLALFTQALQNGLMNRNEIRGRLGLGDIAGGELYTVQTSTGMIPVEKLEEAFQQGMDLAAKAVEAQEETDDEDDPNDEQKAEDRRREPDARQR